MEDGDDIEEVPSGIEQDDANVVTVDHEKKGRAMRYWALSLLLKGGDDLEELRAGEEYYPTYTATNTKTKQELSKLRAKYDAHRALFRMMSGIVCARQNVISSLYLWSNEKLFVSGYTGSVTTVNLQQNCGETWLTWADYIALYSATHQWVFNLDGSVTLIIPNSQYIENFHLATFPMHYRHSGAVRFEMIAILLDTWSS